MKLLEITGSMWASQGEDTDDRFAFRRSRDEEAKKFQSGEGDLSSVISRYKKNLKICLEQGVLLFRGNRNHRGFKLDAESHVYWMEYVKREERRRSVYTSDSMLMNWVDKTWKGFPERGLSYFATMAHNHADGFSLSNEVALIVPADNVRTFGYCDHDFNLSNADHVKFAQGLFKFYRGLLYDYIGHTQYPPLQMVATSFQKKGISLEEPKITNENVNQIVDALNDVVDNISQTSKMIRSFNEQNPGQGSQGEDFIEFVQDFRAELKGTGFNSVEEMMKSITPEAHRAKILHSLSEIPNKKSAPNEVWFEGTYLAFQWHGKDTVEDLKALIA